MITQNSYLRPHGIHTFSLPAWAGRLPDGRTYNTCPAAGVCAAVCYARHGTYRFPAVLAKHERNLARVLDDLPRWEADIRAELAHPKYRGAALRVHDSGDYFSDAYALAWLRLARTVPDVLFYSYTKFTDHKLTRTCRPSCATLRTCRAWLPTMFGTFRGDADRQRECHIPTNIHRPHQPHRRGGEDPVDRVSPPVRLNRPAAHEPRSSPRPVRCGLKCDPHR
ncbi:hypothetical protein F4560_000883 [Saccharothrix ecbatanensis]|uniref:Gene product 88 domain-containing protein n=1 Tax=Saccharothrix ecbatanensis TaxID=1105145 RepID=A0A7W9LYQ5_9PSEU|nr:hypothetical protein [Saccharothrix ecbatanensis]MBB5801115.1 hypothetical protein [Saccharothrix ecbatanensis]